MRSCRIAFIELCSGRSSLEKPVFNRANKNLCAQPPHNAALVITKKRPATTLSGGMDREVRLNKLLNLLAFSFLSKTGLAPQQLSAAILLLANKNFDFATQTLSIKHLTIFRAANSPFFFGALSSELGD